MADLIELRAGLDRDIAALTGGVPSTIALHVNRNGDDSFEVMVMASIPQATFSKQVGTWTLAALDLEAVRALVAWARPKQATARATFSHWSGWTGSHEKNARELARVFEATPKRVVVNRGTPVTERGEPPVGQPSFDLLLDAQGLDIQAPLFWTYTDQDDHERVLAGARSAAETLATSLGVPSARCDGGRLAPAAGGAGTRGGSCGWAAGFAAPRAAAHRSFS